MRRKVYRNLDRPFTLLGVQGKYIPVALGGLLGIVLLALIVGSVAGTFAGLATALVLVIGGYLVLIEVQQRYGEKRLSRKISGIGMPKFILNRSKVWKRLISGSASR